MRTVPTSPASTPSARPRPRSPFILFLLIGLCVLFAVGYMGRVLESARMAERIQAQEQANLRAEQKQVELRAYLEYVQSDAYVEALARQEIGMSQPGDKRVIVLPPAAAAAPSGAPMRAEVVLQPSERAASPGEVGVVPPIWEQWLNLVR